MSPGPPDDGPSADARPPDGGGPPHARQRPRRRRSRWVPRWLPRPGPAVLAVVGLTSLVEVILLSADGGLLGTPLWRGLAYQNGAFWPGLLDNWRPNYAAQPTLMFATYALLHGGPGHLVGNMVTLLPLGEVVGARVGQGGFLVLYAASALGGGLGYAALDASALPMVGASGALHGLVGAWLRWEAMDRRTAGRAALPVLWIGLGVVALNLVMWVTQDGFLAWQTHAGGLVAGWIAADLTARAGWGTRWRPR